VWEQVCERSEESAVGGTKSRPGRLAAENRKLVAKREQLDLLDESVPLASSEQPQ
jgi:hypothetical protein